MNKNLLTEKELTILSKTTELMQCSDAENYKEILGELNRAIANLYEELTSQLIKEFKDGAESFRKEHNIQKRVYGSFSSDNTTHLIMETRNDAEDVVDTLNELIELCGVATVKDLYNFIGIKGDRKSDVNYGWTETIKLNVRQGQTGYLLTLPKKREIFQIDYRY